jgi:cytochrome c oxidase subunit II
MNLSQPQSSSKNNNSIIWIVVSGLAIIVGGFLISLLAPIILPQQASAESRQVDQLFRTMLMIGGAIFLLVEGVLLYSVLRYRAKPGDMSDGPAIHGNTTLEIVWTIIPGIIVFFLTIYSYQVWVSIRSEKPDEHVVDVVGQRFAWSVAEQIPFETVAQIVEAEGLEANPEAMTAIQDEGFVTLNSRELHTYIGQPIKVELNAEDVIHSFWVPSMRIKQDAIPGRETDIRFTPVEAGAYPIVCAELCGGGHGYMAGEGTPEDRRGAWVVVHDTQETYMSDYLVPQLTSLVNPPDDPVLIGRALLESGQYPCATCHVLSDLGWVGAIGPALDGIGSRTQRLAASGELDMASYIHNSIRNPNSYVVPGYAAGLMPQFNPEPDQPNYMPEDDLNAIVQYLLTQ